MLNFRNILKVLTLSLSAGSIFAHAEIKPVSHFELEKYLGTWYEIARLDHRFEKGLDNVKATYSLKDDGNVKVVNTGFNVQKDKWEETIGTAKFAGDKNTGALKVSFFGPFYGGYNIVKLDEQYQYAVVVGNTVDYFWILSRTPQISDSLKQELLKTAQDLNVDEKSLIWVNQSKNLSE